MELELINQLTASGADMVTIIVGYVLLKHELRIQKLESSKKR